MQSEIENLYSRRIILKDNFKEGDLIGNVEWGDIYNEVGQTKSNINADISDISSYIESESHTNAQKLKMLVKMRERRKNRLQMNDSSMDDFSMSQINNIKNRNLVSFYIKKLEADQARKVRSDCKKSFTLHKQVVPVEAESIVDKDDSSGELNDFLEINNEEDEKESFVGSNLNFYRDDFATKVNRKSSNDFQDNIVICSTKSENYNDGYFGELENTDISLEENKIEYDFSKGRQVKVNSNIESRNETMDFLSIQSIIKDIINIFNLPCLDSPSESDAQCAFLYRAGLVDGVITEDNDILLHGGVVYKNFFRKNKSIMKFDPKQIENILGLTTLDLIHLGYVLGSDYTVGLKGIGIKKAVEYIRSDEYKSLQTDSYINVYLKCPVREDWKPIFKTIEVDKVTKFWTRNKMDKERIEELEFLLKNKNQ